MREAKASGAVSSAKRRRGFTASRSRSASSYCSSVISSRVTGSPFDGVGFAASSFRLAIFLASTSRFVRYSSTRGARRSFSSFSKAYTGRDMRARAGVFLSEGRATTAAYRFSCSSQPGLGLIMNFPWIHSAMTASPATAVISTATCRLTAAACAMSRRTGGRHSTGNAGSLGMSGGVNGSKGAKAYPPPPAGEKAPASSCCRYSAGSYPPARVLTAFSTVIAP